MAHVALVAFGDGGEMRQCEISKSPYLLCVIFAFRAKEFSFIWPFWVDLSNENTERISSHASKCMSVVWARGKNGNTNTVEKSLSERLLLNAIKNISSIVECYFIIIMIFLFCFFGWFVHYCHFGWLVCVCVTVVIVPLCLLAFRAKPLVFHLFFGCATFHLFLLCVFISFMLVLVFFSFALSLSLSFSSPHSPPLILFRIHFIRTRIYIFFCL